MLQKLYDLGIQDKMLSVLQAIYSDTQCCVRINGKCTPWFPVECGLKQGCLLSTTLFNLYINDLVDLLKVEHAGIHLGETSVSVLLFADDIASIVIRE